jgi:hypothetical protein
MAAKEDPDSTTSFMALVTGLIPGKIRRVARLGESIHVYYAVM